MTMLSRITLILTILGVVDLVVLRLADIDLVAVWFGAGTVISKIAGVVLGLSAAFQLYRLCDATPEDELRRRISRMPF
jgi:uncharacterized membrane protein YuzA (DUF378 family)